MEVQQCTVRARAPQPAGKRAFIMPDDADCSGDIQPFRQRRQHFTHALRWGGEPVERCVAPGAERGFACLAAEALDGLTFAMGAIADQGMNMCIGDAIIAQVRVGQANPSVRMRLGTPRRLVRAHHGWTAGNIGAVIVAADWRQAGQSSGVRGLRRRSTVAVMTVASDCKEQHHQWMISTAIHIANTSMSQHRDTVIADSLLEACDMKARHEQG